MCESCVPGLVCGLCKLSLWSFISLHRVMSLLLVTCCIVLRTLVSSLVPMVTALLLSTVPGHHIGLPCIRTNQNFRHWFSAFQCMKIAQNYAQVPLPLSHTIQHSKIYIFFFAGMHFFLRKIKMADRKKHMKHVLSKVVKNIIFHHKTLLVMFFRHNKTFGYLFCILNIFWKQKIVKTVWPVRVKSSVLAFV